MIVLDTNVLSELLRPTPDRRVLAWAADRKLSDFFITTITQAELLYGLALMPRGRKHRQIEVAVEALLAEDFAGRILPFDEKAARRYAQLAAQRRAAGRPISQFDAQIAAIVSIQAASIATRNVADFTDCGIEVIDPWSLGQP